MAYYSPVGRPAGRRASSPSRRAAFSGPRSASASKLRKSSGERVRFPVSVSSVIFVHNGIAAELLEMSSKTVTKTGRKRPLSYSFTRG